MPVKTRGMTPKEKRFCDELLTNTDSGTEAVRRAFSEEIRDGRLKNTQINLGIKASRLLHKNANVKNYLQFHSQRAKERVVELVESRKEDIALRSSIFIIESVDGKASQHVNVHNDGATINIGSVNLLMQSLQSTNMPVIEGKGHLNEDTEEDRGGREQSQE
jgi:hypothetical protein